MKEILRNAVDAGALRSVDAWLATHLLDRAGCDDNAVALAVAEASRAASCGHACIDLAKLAGTALFRIPPHEGIAAPALDEWLARLSRSRLIAEGSPQSDDNHAPLVLDACHRLYLRRYWRDEQTVAENIAARLCSAAPETGRAAKQFDRKLRALMDVWFAGRLPDDPQRIAAAVAALRRFAIISGGPGTGKTTTVTRLLALLIALADDHPPVIRLAAPTGKAAARLSASILAARDALRVGGHDAIVERIPSAASTLHRLLGASGDGRAFRHGPDNPLPLDVLVVDEASMIDLAMMARLLAALPKHARLILLGDRDQLASVEAGNVLGDLCHHGSSIHISGELAARLRALGLSPPPAMIAPDDKVAAIADSVAVLTKSHRFPDDSGIGRAARAINDGQAEALFAIADPALSIVEASEASLTAFVDRCIDAHWPDLLADDDPVAVQARFDRFRLLCALREGDTGVARVNALVEWLLVRRGVIDPHGVDAPRPHYRGRPVMVTRNDYSNGLYNGDVGLLLPDHEADGALRACFVQSDGSVRRIAPERLPSHETAWAITVHKSQGSEFDAIALVLPEEEQDLLTRELVYTAITRARKRALIRATRAALTAAVHRKVARASGLRQTLWGMAPERTTAPSNPCTGTTC